MFFVYFIILQNLSFNLAAKIEGLKLRIQFYADFLKNDLEYNLIGKEK